MVNFERSVQGSWTAGLLYRYVIFAPKVSCQRCPVEMCTRTIRVLIYGLCVHVSLVEQNPATVTLLQALCGTVESGYSSCGLTCDANGDTSMYHAHQTLQWANGNLWASYELVPWEVATASFVISRFRQQCKERL